MVRAWCLGPAAAACRVKCPTVFTFHSPHFPEKFKGLTISHGSLLFLSLFLSAKKNKMSQPAESLSHARTHTPS